MENQTEAQKNEALSTIGKTHGNTPLKMIISDNKINWGGFKFQENTHSPVPTIQKDSPTYLEAVRLVEHYKTFVLPCSSDEVAQEIYKLQGHYWQQGMPADLMREVAKDYVRLLAGYSLPVLRRACDEWKVSTAKFCPKLGELKERMDALKSKTETKIKRLQVLIESAAA